MRYREGAEVVSADGEKIGDIERLVIDPSNHDITHLVVGKGFVFKDHRVVPTAVVSSADADTVTLEPAIDLDALPRFETTHYVSMEGTTAVTGDVPDPLVWRYPTHASVPALDDDVPVYPRYPQGQVEVTERQVPEGSLVMATGSTVVTADGEDIGRVREVQTDTGGSLVALVVDPGWFNDEQVIPAHFVGALEDDRVVLAVTGATVGQLQPRDTARPGPI